MWCLLLHVQAQQALLAVQWPQGLDQAQDQDTGNSVEGSMAVRRGSSECSWGQKGNDQR